MEVLCEQPGIEPKKAKTEWQLQSAGSPEGQLGFLGRGLVEPAPRKGNTAKSTFWPHYLPRSPPTELS